MAGRTYGPCRSVRNMKNSASAARGIRSHGHTAGSRSGGRGSRVWVSERSSGMAYQREYSAVICASAREFACTLNAIKAEEASAGTSSFGTFSA